MSLEHDRTTPRRISEINPNIILDPDFTMLIVENCRLAFERAVSLQMNTADNIILPFTDVENPSEYIRIGSEQPAPLYLHRPTLDRARFSRYPFWLREQVILLPLASKQPSSYRELGINRNGQIRLVERQPDEKVLHSPLKQLEAAPYYLSLQSVKVLDHDGNAIDYGSA